MKDGGPAFPSIRDFVNEDTYRTLADGGLTVRQYYKAAALTGMCAGDSENKLNEEIIVRWASNLADAMLKEDEEHGTK